MSKREWHIDEVTLGFVTIKFYLEHVEHRLKPGRFQHTLGVVHMAGELAQIYEAPLEEVLAAAALHDYAKNLDRNELLLLAEQFELSLDPVLSSNSELLHGLVGAELVKSELQIHNETILNAMRYHTFGRGQMSLVEKIVYLADAIELGRDYHGVDDLRKLARKDLEAGLLESVRQTIAYVVKKGWPLHPNSVTLYNELLSERK